MFSGIVAGLQKPKQLKKDNQSLLVTLAIPRGWNIEVGESINIDGVCSTVQSKTKDSFTVFYMHETLRKTILTKINKEHEFNLEKPLTLNALIGGHLVSGHIDTVSKVVSIKSQGEAVVLTFKINPKFIKYIVYKGSITVNGVSLTIVSVTSQEFVVSLIPYTLLHTNLGKLQKGDLVNIEVDQVAKYLEKLLP